MMCRDGTTGHSSNRRAADGAPPGHATTHRAAAAGTERSAPKRAMTPPTSRDVRVELVDNWHKDWVQVLKAIRRVDRRDALRVDDQGWLPARQVLLVAFEPLTHRVAGHLCFRLEPSCDVAGDVVVEAQLDTMGVHPGFERVSVEIASTLRAAAERRAKDLRCRRLVGFEA